MDILNLDKPIDLGDGEWIDDIPELEGVRLKVRSTKFKPFEVATAGLVRRTNKSRRTDEGVIAFNVASGKPLAEHILLDWDLSKATGVTALTSGDEPLPYSQENAIKVLTAKDSFGIGAAYRIGVEWAGDRVADRIAERAATAAGN